MAFIAKNQRVTKPGSTFGYMRVSEPSSINAVSNLSSVDVKEVSILEQMKVNDSHVIVGDKEG